MAQGVPTPEVTELEFRKHYLVTGNVAGSAKAVGLPISTGYELRNRALEDPDFVRAREALRAKVEADAEQMAVAAMQICMERLNDNPVDRVEALADKLTAANAQSARISFQDPGPQYAASLAKLIQATVGVRKYEAERDGVIQTPGTVTVNLQPTPQAASRIASEEAAGGGSSEES